MVLALLMVSSSLQPRKVARIRGVKVSYNGDVTVSTIQKKYDVLNAAEYKELVNSISSLTLLVTLTLLLWAMRITDWQSEIFRTSISTNHNVSLTGGLKNMPYRVSVRLQ